MDKPLSKTVYQLDTENLFIGETFARLDTNVEDGDYLLPARCVTIAPPTLVEHQAALWQSDSQTWQIITDLRGQSAYQTSDGEKITIETVGTLADLNLTDKPRPDETYYWNGKKWQQSPEKAAEKLASDQNTAWENIKTKRYNNTHSGVLVKSVGKWFHNDEASRIQYVALQTMATNGKLPENLSWKTMNNSFITMTAEILADILSAMMTHETADFANAEIHRTKMLKSEKPLEYDYSNGWQAIFVGD